MTIAELKAKYSWAELSQMPGDAKFRCEIFSPLLKNLYENKIVYRERIFGIIKVEELEITPEGFRAKAIPYLLLERDYIHEGRKIGFDEYFFKQEYWHFGATWSFVRLLGDGLGTYGMWKIWCDPEIVNQTEELILKKNFEEANNLLENSK